MVTSSAELAERTRRLREYGWRERYVSEAAGMNSRLDEIQAAILSVKLRHLEAENASRRRCAEIYQARLEGIGLGLPSERPGARHVWHQYVVRGSSEPCGPASMIVPQRWHGLPARS